MLLAAAVVTSLRALAFVVLAALYSFGGWRATLELIFIVRPVLDVVLLLVVLALLFVVSVRGQGGLWSTPQVTGPAMGQEAWYGQAQSEYQHPPPGAPVWGFDAPQQQAEAAPYGYPKQHP